jgi:acetyl-CoA C-acetyltransferase
MRQVGIIGVGITEFGELWDKSFRDIGIEAGLRAIEDAGITGDDLDALYVGNMSAGKFIEQEHVAALMADYTGLSSNHLPAIRVEAAGACGALALAQGYTAIASGMYDIVVVGGAEKMTDVSDAQVTSILSATADQEWESVFGATHTSLYAMMARRHMHEYGTTREQLAQVAVKNHKHGSMNPVAQYRREISVDMVLKAPDVSTPLGLFDCAPLSDGAAAVVLCPFEMSRRFTDTPIKISGSGHATDTLALHDRRDICTMDATVIAGKRAFHQAKRNPRDIDLAEVHDNFTISEILAIEDLRMVPKGQGGAVTEEGSTYVGSKIPINTSGGLKARGNPLGATGVAQVVEVVHQLRGECDKRQVSNANTALTHTIGGTGATAVVHIFERGD